MNLHPFKHMDAANGHALEPSWLSTLDWAVKGALAARLAVYDVERDAWVEPLRRALMSF